MAVQVEGGAGGGRRTGGGGRARLGRWGEEAAARWYREHGFAVVDRNWRCPSGELDVVAVQGRLVVFCEVKARTGTGWGSPAEAVGGLKQVRVRRAAAAWLCQARASPGWTGALQARFDVACVVRGQLVEILADAF